MTVSCIYEQSTGSVTCYDDATGRRLFDARGYSGTGEGRDNPEHNGTVNVGPTPRGQWRIGEVGTSRGPNTIRITHEGGDEEFPETRERGSFLIHGNNDENDASQGCLILGPAQRRLIIEHGGGTLRVMR